MIDETIRHELEQIVSGDDIRFDEPLDAYASMGVGGRADALACPRSREEASRLVALAIRRRIPFFPVGNWTNLIIRDGGFRGLMVCLKNMRTIQCGVEQTGRGRILAEAGADLADLVALSGDEGLSGLEFCAGIPGSVGGAVKMNAGAYGREMKDVIGSVTLMGPEGACREYAGGELPFRYRCLDIAPGQVILEATFLLDRADAGAVKAKIKDIMDKRTGKHPLEFKSAGSVFKNPKGRPAGQLIDEAGLKGMQVGGAKVSEKHGNFIINLGNAKAKDITDLIEVVREKVHQCHGIVLEPEVVIVGEAE